MESEPILATPHRPPARIADLETIRTAAVLSPVVAAVQFALQLEHRPWLRTAIFTDAVVQAGAPADSFTISEERGRFVLRKKATDSILGTYEASDRIEGPGFSFGPVDPDLLLERISFRLDSHAEATFLLRTRVVVEEQPEPGVLHIAFSDPDATFAASVINLVAESYVAHSISANTGTHGRRREAIGDQVRHLTDSLMAAQAEWAASQESNRMVQPALELDGLMTAALSAESQLNDLRFRERVLASVAGAFDGRAVPRDSIHALMIKGRSLIPGAPAAYARFRELEARRLALTASSNGGLTESNAEVRRVDAELDLVEDQIGRLAQGALDLARAQTQGTRTRLGGVRSDLASVRYRSTEYERARQWTEAIERQLDMLYDLYFEAQIEGGAEAGHVSVLDAASVPHSPDPSLKAPLLVLALLSAVILGSLGATTLDRLDTTVRRAADAERVAGLPMLGTIPRIQGDSGDPKSQLVSKEAFRGLRTNMRFALPSAPKLVAVTSAEPGAGKSTVVANLALAMAEQGERVLLLDADLRRPQAHRILGVDRGPGLSNLLAGTIPVLDAIAPSPAHELLWVLPAGSATEVPAELIGGEAFAYLLRRLPREFDVVLLDTSPVLAVTDASLIGPSVDAVLLVARANQTDGGALATAVSQLRAVKTPLAGIVLNDMPLADVGYSSYYDSYYGNAPADQRQRPVLST